MDRLVAATGTHDHVAVLFEDDVGAVVEIEDRDGIQLGRGAAWLGHRLRVDEVDLEGMRRGHMRAGSSTSTGDMPG